MVLGNSVTVAPGEIKRVSSTTTGNGAQNIQARIESDVATNGFDVIAWRPQIEAKSYATSWTDGTRQAEMCNTSCDGVAESQAGTVEFWAYISDQFKSTPTGPLFSIRTKDNSNYILALRSFNTNQLQLVTRNDSGSVTQTGTCSMPLVGWHAFAIKYTKGGNIVCFIDGVQQINFASNMESSFGKCYVGGNGATAGNIVVDNLRISNVARTDAEILAAYNTNAPLTVDQYTTCLLDFDDSLELKQGLIVPDRFKAVQAVNL
jgi:hypothetical protein